MSKYSVFDLSHERKMTGNMGLLYPCMMLEVMPGDRFKGSSEMALRMLPLISPMMHRVDVFIHYFFVPTRLLWKNFSDFLTGGDKGTTTVVAPYMKNSNNRYFSVANGSLGDYLGLPSGPNGLGGDLSVYCSALPFRAYALVYNEWYRDESIIDPVGFSDADGADTTTNTALLRRAWKRGYFENALPWAQKGEPVTLPTVEGAEVYAGTAPTRLRVAGTGDDAVNMGFLRGGSTGVSANSATIRCAEAASTPPSNKTNLYVNGEGVSINEFRLAFQVQRFLERNARGGSRYIEFLLSHFGVRSSDARLQRPEYVGGGRCPVVIGDVLQTSETTEGGTPQGNMAGQGYAAMRTPSFNFRSEEFGYLVGLISIMPQPTYQQGLHKMWSRFSRYDYPFPVFSHLGDQAITEKELYYTTQTVDSSNASYSEANETIFGFAPRYDEMRKIPSSVHGEFRDTLEFWHLGRVFDSAPTLSAEFISCNPSDRVFAVQDGSDHLVVQILNNVSVVRQLPKYGVPGLVDHN